MKKKEMNMKKSESTVSLENGIIGKNVIVRATVAGVHAGKVTAFDSATQTVILAKAYRLWRVYTQDKSGSISDIAANGLKPDGKHSIGAELASVTIVNPTGLELAEMTDEAYTSIKKWTN
jgi:hypothetical protein